MSTIRKQALTGSLVIYIGFAIGAINTYLFTKQGLFTTEQYGLTRIFMDFGELMSAVGGLGATAVIYKFYPFYRSNLQQKDVDIVTWAMLLSMLGAVVILICGWFFKDVFVQVFKNTPFLLPFYQWLFPFALGYLFFKVVESFCWVTYKSVLSSFFKEIVFRIYTLFLILAYFFKLINFNQFIYIYSFAFAIIFIVIFTYLILKKQVGLSFKISRVTKKFYRKMLSLQTLVLSGQIIMAIGTVVDTIFIAGMLPNGLALAGIYTFAAYGASIIDAPRRSLSNVSYGSLSQAWKDKNLNEIQRIYSRSCINMLIFSLLIYGVIVLVMKDAINVFNINSDFSAGILLLVLLGASRIIDAGTGVNSQIIATSNLWRFDFIMGIILLAMRLPLTFFLIRNYGILGSAIAELTSITVYNFIRMEFLRRKFNMQPFTIKTVYTLLLAAIAFLTSYFLFFNLDGWLAIILKGFIFSAIMLAGIFYLKLSPDALQLYDKFIAKRFKKR